MINSQSVTDCAKMVSIRSLRNGRVFRLGRQMLMRGEDIVESGGPRVEGLRKRSAISGQRSAISVTSAMNHITADSADDAVYGRDRGPAVPGRPLLNGDGR